MPNCKACGAEMTWAINEKTGKNIPLVPVPENPAPGLTRYSLAASALVQRCRRDDAGEWFSHFQDCPMANQFSRGKR